MCYLSLYRNLYLKLVIIRLYFAHCTFSFSSLKRGMVDHVNVVVFFVLLFFAFVNRPFPFVLGLAHTSHRTGCLNANRAIDKDLIFVIRIFTRL